ncbi:MAG: TetR/AcrR family transcriptional regulator [Cohaesibacteraceae bacterium]|nr:TetR/AcrR family transcriptional regulator [Cohaesibacteraceae bacterium]
MSIKTKKNSHHHGHLREAIIEAALKLINEGGLGALSLRKCAALAGVSHAAPAHHFGGLAGILTALVTIGFERLNQSMAADLEHANPNSYAQLLAICEGYLTFAETNEALFELMFTSSVPDFSDPALQKASGTAFEILAKGCLPFADNPDHLQTLQIRIWSLVHGFADLSRGHRARPGYHPIRTTTFADVFSNVIPNIVMLPPENK